MSCHYFLYVFFILKIEFLSYLFVHGGTLSYHLEWSTNLVSTKLRNVGKIFWFIGVTAIWWWNFRNSLFPFMGLKMELAFRVVTAIGFYKKISHDLQFWRKNADWSEDKVSIHTKEICLRVNTSVGFFSIQECDHNIIVVSFRLYWAQGLKDKEEEEREVKEEWVSRGSLYWRQRLIIYACSYSLIQ